ncbi:MAG: glycosyltransferase family 39 protein [Chloroflexota bacterium]|nr:glycosyltransferase family 39 protein [Chloroflexota bacterium]MDE2909680.1 glycosyltransferase family 39 protein [Chloroflexota bacterium]
MNRFTDSSWFMSVAFALLLIASAALKLYASRLLAWEVDYVPVLARGQTWLDGGAFPVVGTLSSVGAFNMPFLVWMQLPALLVTRDVRLVLVGTQLSFNLLTTCILFRLGGELFDRRAGLLAAMLFAFSNVGITGAFTAWAQLQLPGFFALFAYFLFRWKRENRDWQTALCLLMATAAFMTHFSAALLYGVLVIALILLGLPLNRRGLLAGFLLSLIMLAPYLIYEARVDFVDLQAHITRRSRISAEVVAEYAHLRPMGRAHEDTAAQEGDESVVAPAEPQRSRIERGIAWLLSIPHQILVGLRLAFSADLATLRQHQPALHQAVPLLRALLEACFWAGLLVAASRFARQLRSAFSAIAGDQNRNRSGWRAQKLIIRSAAGRNLALFLLVLSFVAGLCLARAGPNQQPTYYYGVSGLQFLICGYGIYSLASYRRLTVLAVALVFVYVGLSASDTVLRVSRHDPAEHSALNLNLYSSIYDAAAWIASDWSEPGSVAVNYDLLPDLPQLWWVLPRHTVDESYRLGMAFDHLLNSTFELENSNRNPSGIADQSDYVVTSARGMERYRLGDYQAARFGALVALKPS